MSDPDIVGSFASEPTITGQFEPDIVIQGNVDQQFPAQISVASVTTGDPGTDASVVNVGTPGNARLQFTIPRGAQGLQGDTGPQGEQGEQGIQGEQGEKGETGDTGATGPANTLSIGTVEDGATADATITGTAPNQTLNLTLPKGDKGDKGDQGDPGTAGADGADGVVQSLVAGSNITIDATDPANPIINSTASGSGDVVGPSSAVDGTPAVFDGTTGKLLKNITYAAFKTLLSLAKVDVGLGNVDNTSDSTKNAATATLTNKTLTSPVINSATGSAASSFTATTQSVLDNSTKLATTAYVDRTTREKLSADRTYYVDVTNGSDSNNGLASGSGHAFQTLQKAINVVAALDINIFDVTINVADGTYTGGASVTAAWLGSGSVSVVGNTTTPANVIINPTGAACFSVTGGGSLSVSGMELRGFFCLQAGRNSSITGKAALRFGAAGAYQVYANGGLIGLSNNYSIVGAAGCHWLADSAGTLNAVGLTITITGTPAIGTFAIAGGVGTSIACFSNTFSGSTTGSRYSVNNGAFINTNGGGTSYLPGNSAGSGTNFSASPWGLYQ